MTKRFDGFDDWNTRVIGTNASGLTVRGGGAPGFAPKYADAGVVPRNERYLQFLTDSTADYRAVSLDALDADANRATFDIVDAFSYDLLTTEDWTLYGRGQGTATVTDFVRARVVKASGVIAIDRMVASAYTAGSGASAGSVTLSAGKSYLVRFRGVAGAVSLKVWDAALGMAGEPAAFNLTPTGLTPTAAGWIGIGGRHSLLPAKVAPHNFIATATNGDVAVCPITDAEFIAWMNDGTKRRCATVVMTAIGYDSTTPPYTKTIKAQLSNMGYNAHEQDGLANPHFQGIITKVPTFSVDLPAGFSGGGSTSVGEMVISNPAVKTDKQQNLFTYSEQADNAAWTKSNLTVSANSVAAFDGVVRADTLTENTAVNVFHDCSQSIGNQVAGVEYTMQVKVKANGRTKCEFGFYAPAPFGGVYQIGRYDLTAVTAVISSGTPSMGIQDLGGGWYLLTIAARCTVAGAGAMFIRPMNAASATQYTGDGVSGIYVDQFHARHSQASFRYVATTASSIDRFTAAKARKGIRDPYLQYAWNRDGYVLRLGDPSRPWHDHRVILRGRVGVPKAPSVSRIAFPLADMSDVLNADVNSHLFTSGDYVDQRKPELFGNPAMIEPPLTDAVGLVFTLSRRAILAGSFGTQDTGTGYNNGTAIHAGNVTVTAVDTGLDEFTTSADHGMDAGYVMQFFSGPLPTVSGTALAVNTDYYVKTVSALNKFTLARTLGGATIDLTASATGAFLYGYGYRFSTAAAATITLVNSPGTGRVTANASDAGGNKLGQIYAAIGFDAMALSLNMKDQASFDALDAAYSAVTAGLWIGTEKTSGVEAFSRFANGTFTWYCPTPDGRLQVGRYALPGTAVDTLIEADIKAGSMQITDTIRPVDMSTAQVTYSPFFLTSGFLVLPSVSSPAIKQNKIFLAPYSYGASSTPLENYPALIDANRNAVFETLLTGVATEVRDHLAAFYKWKLGVFSVQARLRCALYKLGSTVRVQHGRLGWEIYNSANPVSPDNTTTIDAELAVVVGKSFDLKKPYPIGLKLLRPIHAVFPTADIT